MNKQNPNPDQKETQLLENRDSYLEGDRGEYLIKRRDTLLEKKFLYGKGDRGNMKLGSIYSTDNFYCCTNLMVI